MMRSFDPVAAASFSSVRVEGRERPLSRRAIALWLVFMRSASLAWVRLARRAQRQGGKRSLAGALLHLDQQDLDRGGADILRVVEWRGFAPLAGAGNFVEIPVRAIGEADAQLAAGDDVRDAPRVGVAAVPLAGEQGIFEHPDVIIFEDQSEVFGRCGEGVNLRRGRHLLPGGRGGGERRRRGA